MSIERRTQLHFAALVALTMLTWVGKITAAGAMPRPPVDLLVEPRPGCQEQEPGRKDEYADMATAIYERVAPAVVLIHAVSINPYRLTERVEHSVGSGFIIDPEGLVLTNSHVVFGRQSLVVRLNDGTDLPARLIGADPILDIAVLRIPKLKQNALAVVKLGDSDCVRVGEDMLALGSPLGLDQSLTRGIVSAKSSASRPQMFLTLRTSDWRSRSTWPRRRCRRSSDKADSSVPGLVFMGNSSITICKDGSASRWRSAFWSRWWSRVALPSKLICAAGSWS